MAKPRHRALAIGLVSVLAAGSVLAPVVSFRFHFRIRFRLCACRQRCYRNRSRRDYQELSADELAALAEADTEADAGDAAVAAGDAVSLLSSARLSP